MDRTRPTLALRVLWTGCHALTKSMGRVMAECGAVSLERQGHRRRVALSVEGDYHSEYSLVWTPATDQMHRGHHDTDRAAEIGACGIAILLVRELDGLTVVLQSRRGSGFDYWLGDAGDPLFQNKARLEVSGINRGDASRVEARTRQKLAQTAASEGVGLPAYVVVVEFGRPVARVVRKGR